MLDRYKLPITFDAARLQTDLARLRSDLYVPHFNQRQYVGDWSVLPLREPEGSLVPGYSDPSKTGKFVNTQYLDTLPYFQEVIDCFSPIRGKGAVQSARLMRLGPGGIITEHKDFNLGIEYGEIRLHIPIVTNSLVEFYANCDRLTMLPGECWYVDFGLPHSVKNLGDTERVHLVLDCVVDEHVRSFFPEGVHLRIS